MSWKPSSESHSFFLKPITHCTFTERILCSIVCLNVYIVLKNFFWKTLLLLEAHNSLYFHRAPSLFNCMFECVNCFEIFLLKAIASTWSPPLTVLSQSAYFVQLFVWMCIMFWKTSESHYFCLKPTAQCTFAERILCSIVCLNVYNDLKTSFESHCFCLKPTTQCTSTMSIFCLIVCLNMYNVSMISSESHCLCLKSTTNWTFTDRILCSIVGLNVCNVLKNFFWKALLLLEAHQPLYFHRARTLFNCMFEGV